MQANNKTLNWYALKVFNNRLLQMQETIQREAGEDNGQGNSTNDSTVETYIAMSSKEIPATTSSRSRSKAEVSYSGNKLTLVPKSKRAIINESNNPQQTQTVKKPLVASLMFIRCTETFLKTLKHNHLSEFSYYTRYSEDHKVPAVIPDGQMQAFIWLTSEDTDVTYIGEPKDIKLGDRVKVVEGPFKGLIGNVKRIKKDRKFVITIGSIAAFTIGGITHKMVKKIN
jgi:transcription antitermination factor NusG